jgi:hypothetical protein
MNERIDAVRRTIHQHINSTTQSIPHQIRGINLKWLFKLYHLKELQTKRNAFLQNQVLSSSISSVGMTSHENPLSFHKFCDSLSRQCVFSNESTISLSIPKEMKMELEPIVNTSESERFVSTSNVLDCTESYLQSLFQSILPPSSVVSKVEPSHQTNSSIVIEKFSTTYSKDNETSSHQAVPQESVLDFQKLRNLVFPDIHIHTHTHTISLFLFLP